MGRGRELKADAPHRPGLRRLLAAACLLLLTGCAARRGLEGDPLVGGGPPIDRAAPDAKAPAGTTTAAVIPPPPTHSPTSPAALANGAPQPLGGERDLRIGTPASLPGQGDGGAWRGPATAATTGGTKLGGPEPVNDSASRLTPTPAAGAAVTLTSGAAAAEYAQLQDALLARGVSWQQLEMWGETGEWKFSCSVPNRQNKSLLTHYEAQSRDRYGLAALRAVLQKIDQAQPR